MCVKGVYTFNMDNNNIKTTIRQKVQTKSTNKKYKQKVQTKINQHFFKFQIFQIFSFSYHGPVPCGYVS